jgi:small subunit ribosomal protein S8
MEHCLWHMVNNIKNGQKSKKSFVINKRNNLSISLLNVLWKEGFILGYTVEDKNKLKIFLKYKNSNSALKFIQVLSKPSKKIYFSSSKLWKLQINFGVAVISTSKGFLTLNECKRLNIGGELFIVLK